MQLELPKRLNSILPILKWNLTFCFRKSHVVNSAQFKSCVFQQRLYYIKINWGYVFEDTYLRESEKSGSLCVLGINRTNQASHRCSSLLVFQERRFILSLHFYVLIFFIEIVFVLIGTKKQTQIPCRSPHLLLLLAPQSLNIPLALPFSQTVFCIACFFSRRTWITVALIAESPPVILGQF